MKEISVWIRAIFNWHMMLAAFFILTPTFLNNYTGITGKLFAATPQTSGMFRHTALYMFHQQWHEARALVINRPLDRKSYPRLPDLLKKYPNIPLYWGGPVYDSDVVFILHIQDDTTIRVDLLPDWQKDNPDILEEIDKSPENYRVFVGYAGWGVLQYNLEDALGTWEASEGLPQKLIKEEGLDSEEIWQRVIGESDEKRKPLNPQIM